MSQVIMKQLTKLDVDTNIVLHLSNGSVIKGLVGENENHQTHLTIHSDNICYMVDNSSVIAYGIIFQE